jgi:DNA invertase Pin-like site-specific DNA recombinase
VPKPAGRVAVAGEGQFIAQSNMQMIYKGRPASIDGDQVRKLKADGMGPTEIAKALKIGRASVYRVLMTTG